MGVLVGTARMGTMLIPTQTSTCVLFTKTAPVVKSPSSPVCGNVTATATAIPVAMEVVCLALTLASFTRDATLPATATTQQIHVVLAGTARMGTMLIPTQTSTS